LWLADATQKEIKTPKSKGRKRPKSGDKIKPKHPGIVKKLVDKALLGRLFEKRFRDATSRVIF